MSIEYASEKLSEAVQALATGEGDVRNRLVQAAVPLAMVSDKDLPARLRKKYKAIWKELTKHKAPNKYTSDLAYTLGKMRNKTGSKIATRIYSLDGEVTARLRQG